MQLAGPFQAIPLLYAVPALLVTLLVRTGQIAHGCESVPDGKGAKVRRYDWHGSFLLEKLSWGPSQRAAVIVYKQHVALRSFVGRTDLLSGMDAQGAAPAAATSSQEQPAAADAEVSGREEGQVVPGRRKPPEQLLRARIALRRAISELGPGLEAARAKLQAQLGQLEESFQAYHSSRQHSLLVFCVSAYTLDALVRAGYANSALRGAQALVRAATSASRAVVGLALRPLRLLRCELAAAEHLMGFTNP
jgi:hypothetical protein